MSTPGQVENVRRNTSERDESKYSDGDISEWIDQLGESATIAKIWREKAAEYSELVNTSEGGSSRSLSDLLKNALAMEKVWTATVADEKTVTSPIGPRVKRIVRT